MARRVILLVYGMYVMWAISTHTSTCFVFSCVCVTQTLKSSASLAHATKLTLSQNLFTAISIGVFFLVVILPHTSISVFILYDCCLQLTYWYLCTRYAQQNMNKDGGRSVERIAGKAKSNLIQKPKNNSQT